MEYRAISLHQPWASLVALGIKKYETRGWSTRFRGKLLICSAKKPVDDSLGNRLKQIADLSKVENLLYFFNNSVHLGKVLCVVNLVDCYLMTTDGQNIKAEGRKVSELEKLCGDWQTGRYAWELANLMPLPEPISIKGKQGLWIPDSSIITKVKKQLSIG